MAGAMTRPPPRPGLRLAPSPGKSALRQGSRPGQGPQPTIGGLAETFLGEARQNPHAASEVYRSAAQTFAGLAADPRNHAAVKQLHKMANEFALMATYRVPRMATLDDFQQLLTETALAADEDDMEMIARRREIHEETGASGLTRVSIAPRTFNSEAPIGRWSYFKWNPTQAEIDNKIVQSQTLVFWQGDKHEAQAMTLDVGVLDLPPPPPGSLSSGTSTRPYAQVEYGSDGNRVVAKIDVGMGKRLTVVGNYVSLLVGMDPPMADVAAGQLQIGASLGTFAAPSLVPVTKTEYIDGLDDAQTTGYIGLPLRAGALLPVQTTAEAGILGLRFYGPNGGSPLYVLNYPVSTPGASPIPLSNDVAFLKVYNGTGVEVNIRLIFQLSL